MHGTDLSASTIWYRAGLQNGIYASILNVCYCSFDYVSVDIVFILFSEHYPDLSIYPRIGCVGMVASSGSL